MRYSSLQKTIAYVLLFAFFLQISVNIPGITSLVFARESSFYNLVSVIVDEKTYNEVKSELDTYSRDISSNLENTRVVILPVPEDASPFSIASMNEALYFDGYKSLSPVDFESRLSTTIFVGNIPLPRVYKGNEFSRTALPYVDFINKSYIYNKETKRYEENSSSNSEIKAEVEFSFISPNTGDFKENINSLKKFFKKSHDYYTGQGAYKQTNAIINGNKDEELDHLLYRPYVFYYDYVREAKSFSKDLYESYLSTRKNNEDLAYTRYGQDLLGKMKGSFDKSQQSIADLAKKVDPNLKIPSAATTGATGIGYDIHLGMVIENLKRNFINSFGKGVMTDLRKDVFNAGRYNFGTEVNVDFLPHVVSNMDTIADEILKQQNNELEKQVDEIVEKISRKIAVPMEFHEPGSDYANYLYGNRTSNITKAEQCSVFRGSSNLVEANRGYYIPHSQSDIERMRQMGIECLNGEMGNMPGTQGLWGKYSPLNTDPNTIGQGPLKLKLNHGPHQGAIEPLFDLKGSKLVKENGNSVNPYQCFENNYILERTSGYQLKGQGWNCFTVANARNHNFPWNHIEYDDYINHRSTPCRIDIYLNGSYIRNIAGIIRGSGSYSCGENYRYKAVDSVVHHKEPTPETQNAQRGNTASSKGGPSTVSEPIDDPRFVDFIRSDGKYVRINYPKLFPLRSGQTLEEARVVVNDYIKKYNEFLKSIVSLKSLGDEPHADIKANPYYNKGISIIGRNDGVAQLLKKSEYNPNMNPELKVDIDKLAWAVMRNSLGSSDKYEFLFEEYLSGKGVNKDISFLPRFKEQYEIAYLGAYGNAQNMLVGFHPEAKDTSPYSEIIGKNQELSAKIMGNGVSRSSIAAGSTSSFNATDSYDAGIQSMIGSYITSSSGQRRSHQPIPFKCAPPDGVPIWKWPSALMCRIKDMLPPKIKMSDGSCSASHLEITMSDDKGGFYNFPSSSNSVGSSIGNNISQNKNNSNSSNGNSSNNKSGFNQTNNRNPGICVADANKNGIADCLEKINTLKLTADSSTYAYNAYAGLFGSFYDENGQIATYINNTKVRFEIIKIEKAKDETKDLTNSNLEVVYDVSDKNLSDESIIQKYLNFKNITSRSSLGVAKYGFSTKNQELNIYFKAISETDSKDGTNKKVIESNTLRVEVRGKSLSTLSGVYSKTSGELDESSNIIEASDKTNIYIFDLENKNIDDFKGQFSQVSESEKNFMVGMLKQTKGKNSSDVKYPINLKLLLDGNIVQELDIKNRQDFIKLSPLSNTGNYSLRITDSEGMSTFREIYVVPASAQKVDIKLGTNTFLSGGSISTNVFTIYDKYNNPASGKKYLAELELSGDNFAFYNGGKESKTLNFELYEAYQVFMIKSLDKVGEGTINVKIIDSDTNKVVATKSEKIKSVKNINVSIENKEMLVGGENYKLKVSLLDDNGNIIPGINSRLYFSGNSNYFVTEEPYFEIKDSQAEVEIKTRTLAGKSIPVEVQIEGISKIFNTNISIKPLSPVKLDIITGESKLEAKPDKFTTVYLELKDRYNNTVYTDSSTKASVETKGQISGSGEVTFNEGLASFRLYATNTPGVGYFKVSTNPSLSQNSFSTIGSSGKTSVNGVGENAGRIETYYFWNKEKIEKKHFNGLYSVLQGANYGDIEQTDYLAGALIFSDKSRALAATSLIESGLKKDNIFSVNKNGNLLNIISKSDLLQDIELTPAIDGGKLYFDAYNKSLNVNIGKVYYNLKDVKLNICNEKISEKCFDSTKTSIVGFTNSKDYRFYNHSGRLFLADRQGNEILSIDEKGNFKKKNSIYFEINNRNSAGYLDLDLVIGDKKVGSLGVNVLESKIEVSRTKEIFENRKTLDKNIVLLNIDSTFYGTYNSGNEVVVFYNDPFASKGALSNFAETSNYGFENFPNEGGIGWKDSNKTLLSFAAGKTVGASTKDYMSVYMINVGDPFVRLKEQRKTFTGTKELKKFDPTIGKIISKDEEVLDYKIFDYNNDGKQDLLLQRRDNYLELFENKDVKDRFVSHGSVANIYDLGSFFEAGDFTGDGYGDIFFIARDGKPYILNNISKDFTRLDLSPQIAPTSRIIEASVFDMDNDGKSDIVTLNEAGEVDIFYGGGTPAKPQFTKKNITTGLGLALSSDVRKSGGAMYFPGLYQPNLNMSAAERVAQMGSTNISNQTVDAEIYINLPHKEEDEKVDISTLENMPKFQKTVSYLKSEYLSSAGVSYQKTFKDRNGGFLVSGDTIDVEIKLKNNSGKDISNAIFLERLEKYFNIDLRTIKNSKNIKVGNAFGGYDFSLKGFSLANGEEMTITYSGSSRKLTHFNLRTGLFEKDDKYGDILLDNVSDGCGSPYSLYKSIAARTYTKKGVDVEQCSSSQLPPLLKDMSTDSNGDGTPDKIEELKNDKQKLQEYAKKEMAISNKDSDNDGIPDDTDGFNGNSSSLEEGLDQTQRILDGLTCGFNDPSCFSSPINWAPLAPGNDPTFLGMPFGDGLKVEEGLPFFSMITWIRAGKKCVPTFYPMSPLGPGCAAPSAGGRLGTWSPTDFFRWFITPTLTGGVGTALCFGAPASVWGYSIPPGVAPLFPGGNCIVIAKPLIKCSSDGSEGDPEEAGTATNFEGFSTVNAGPRGIGSSNSKGGSGASGNRNKYSTNAPATLKTCSANTGGTSIDPNYVKRYLDSSGGKTDSGVLNLKTFNKVVESPNNDVGSPIFRVGSSIGPGVSVDLSIGAGSDFADIEKIQEERIESFPAFLMDWVVRQIDEIVSKLTDFPTIFVILPDFTGIYDADNTWDSNWDDFRKKLAGMKEIGGKKIAPQVNSGIREAYEFMSTLPFVNVRQEMVGVTLPWISEAEINQAKVSREGTIKQWQEEAAKYSKLGYGDITPQVSGLIGSVRRNLRIIDSYKKIPEQVMGLINKKQDYLEQILCNVEMVSDLIGGRIGKNGERFKAWVELVLIIKAILKAWQELIDIFVNYEEECKECKNERHDLLNWQFQIISMIVPKIPVVRFPKWPDVIVDLHNIRASLDISLPEFQLDYKRIILPNLPNLNLPNVPGVSINLPDIPTLPEFRVPELPDIPSLPEIELPNLPPPLKLPKLFEGFEFIIDIAKLVVKAMCILKSSPFHPEWRAGDQIAFITERNGFLGIDFINKTLPEFSFPFVDAIEVVAYVNFEFETDFITELAEQLVQPINSFTNDFTNIFKISLDDLDIGSKVVPGNIDVDVNITSFEKTQFKKDLALKTVLAGAIQKIISKGEEFAKKHEGETITNQEFIQIVNKTLASESVASDSRLDGMRSIWKQVNDYTFSSENKLIKELQEYNYKKYDTVKDIILTEQQKNKELLRDLINSRSEKIKVSSKNSSSVDIYKKSLSEYNKKTIENIGKMLDFDEKNSVKSELKQLGTEVLKRSDKVFGEISRTYGLDSTPLETYKNARNTLAAANTSATPVTVSSSGTCGAAANASQTHSYNYYGIYVLERGRSYRLFDYVSELKGGERTTPIDVDSDGDEDLLYFVNNTLYLKENLDKKKDKKLYLNEAPIVVNPSNNKFLNGKFIEAVNNLYESDISSGMVSLSFSPLQNIYNYRLTYYDIVDKYLNPDREEINTYKNKNIVDGIASSDYVSIVEEKGEFVKRKDLVYLGRIGNYRGLEVNTYEMKSIRKDLQSGKSVTISSGTKLYSGPNYLELTYKLDNDDEETQSLRLEPNTNIEAKESLIIVGISRGDGFVETTNEVTYKGDQIAKLRGLPLPFETKITYTGDKQQLTNSSYVDLYYYDNSSLTLDFKEVYSWELYNLGNDTSDYLFAINRKDDYYYAKLSGFKNGIVGTGSNQVLLSSQSKADRNLPEVELNSIKVPVYQEVEINITDKVSDYGGTKGIRDIYVDFFPERDTNGDLNPKNDNDSMPNLQIFKRGDSIILKVGKFTSLLKKKIGINVIDENQNRGYTEVNLEIYSPIPEIESYDGVTISGKISEKLQGEPINFYRFRGGDLTKLGDEKDNLTVFTNKDGKYSLKTGLFEGNLTVKDKNGQQIATILEKTGKISIENSAATKYDIYVAKQENTNYPEIFIRDNKQKDIFKQELRVNGNAKVTLVNDFENLEKNGVYLKNYQNNFEFYILPENISNNPGVLVGYYSSDKNKTPIFKIYPDGRLDLPNSYKLKYDDFKNYIVISVSNESGEKLFDILYKIDADYVIN
ncbi:VCBS repeat-containing protein [Candidatus Gracilibacteria bacterium]|nr:MAG: VCBS repeat-containing protein [Candidatus Gracilibacteria bacterium]